MKLQPIKKGRSSADERLKPFQMSFTFKVVGNTLEIYWDRNDDDLCR